MRSMKFIQNYHNEHTKSNFGMLIVVILYELHTSHFAVCVAALMHIGNMFIIFTSHAVCHM